MNNNLLFKVIKYIRTNIVDLNKKFIKRHNNDEAKDKLNFRNTLYASTQILKKSSIDNVVADLKLDNIVTVSKNSLVKKRNNDTAGVCIKELNDNMLKMIYDPKNKFLKPYNFKLGPDKKSYVCSGVNYNKNDKNLFINRTTKRFIASDGSQLNVSKNLINNNDVKASKSKNYGVVTLSCLFDVINEIPISYHPTQSTSTDIEKKSK